MTHEIGIGFLGMGNVGERVVATLLERADAFREQTGAALSLRRVAVKDPGRARGIDLPGGVLTGDAGEVLDDPSVDIVVEVIGGDGAAGEYVRRALAGGRHVVSANKELVAKAGPELFDLARANEAGAPIRGERWRGYPGHLAAAAGPAGESRRCDPGDHQRHD